MKKLVVICGPTAVGKTNTAVKLTQIYNGVIVSADSRQVYKHMDIGTGKDGNYLGCDLVSPRSSISVSMYAKEINKILEQIWKENKTPFLVGGSGLYLKSIIDGFETLNIPKNNKLRSFLNSYSPFQLFEKLAELDPIKAGNMNSSDKNNPLRLVRAIEVAQYRFSNKKSHLSSKPSFKTLMIGLYASDEWLKEKIEKRVIARIKSGFFDEVKSLLSSGVQWSDQSMQSYGYKESRDYFDGKISLAEFKSEWVNKELKYAREQKKWFMHDSRVRWFDVNDSHSFDQINYLVYRFLEQRMD